MIPSVPFIGISIYFALGIFLAHSIPFLQCIPPVSSLAFLCLFLISTWPAWLNSKSAFSFAPLTHSAMAALHCLLAGIACYNATQHYSATHIVHHIQENQEVQLLGEVLSRPTFSRQSARFVFLAHRLYTDKDIIQTTGKVQVYIDEELVGATPGHLMLIKGKLAKPIRPRNPGTFNQEKYLHARGIQSVMYGTSQIVVSPPDDISQLFRQQVFQLQQYILTRIEANLASDISRSVMQALLLGDQSAIHTEIISAFQQTGLTHLLAVSGLHVMLVGFLVYQLLRPILIRLGLTWYQTEFARAMVTCMLLGTYALITGAKAPVVRAFLMAALFILGPLFRKPASSVNSIGLAALILLVYRPQYLFDVGFQLSFSAVLGIIFLLRRFNNIIDPQSKLLTRITQSFFVSLSATISTLPILLFHFGYVSFAGLLLNFIALPLTSGALCAGLAMIGLSPLSAFLASLAGSAAESLLFVLILITEQGAGLMSSLAITPGKISWSAMVILLSILLLLLGILSGKRLRWRIVLLSLAITTGLMWMSVFTSPQSRQLSVVFFDVDHGDACFVQFPNGKTLLIDTGNQGSFTDSADRIILPFLFSQGITSIDTILLSHDHRDHTGGLATLLNRVDVGRVVHAFPQGYPGKEAMAHLRYQSVLAGDTLHIDPSSRIRILSPDKQLINHPNINERSIVLQLTFGEINFLFLGDAEIEAERFIQKYFPAFLYSDIIKVGHHGSKTSSSQPLIESILTGNGEDIHSKTPTALISVGRSIGYDLPDEIVLTRWKTAGAAIHITQKSGAYWIQSNGKDLWKRPY